MKSTQESLLSGARSSTEYFVSTFLFGILFGIAAASAGIEHGIALFMSASVFSASAQFAALEFWQDPLPLASIALSVALISTRNILLGMSLTHHLDGHSMLRRIVSLAVLTDPGVVMTLRKNSDDDPLGYLTGYGLSLLVSWVTSSWIGLTFANLFASANLESLDFAGPLVIGTMMMLLIRGGNGAHYKAWTVAAATAYATAENGLPGFAILLASVGAGTITSLLIQEIRRARSD